jgi:hypothetical protein
MIWLTWRQHRRYFLFAGIGLAVLAGVLVPTGLAMRAAYADTGLAACLHGLGTAELVDTHRLLRCDGPAERFNNTYGTLVLPAVLLVLLPALIGMFFGAPLVAREVEQGTHRLVWTQGVSRLRWLLVKLSLVAAGATVLAVAYAVLTSWWLTPLANADQFNGRFGFPYFDLYGITPVGYTLFALALGVCAGTLTRRTLPAMALTLGAFLATRIVVTVAARPRFQSPLRRQFPIITDLAPNRSVGDWVLSDGIYDPGGRLVADNTVGICPVAEAEGCGSADRFNVWTYQPGSRLWLFQYVEAGVYLALAALLVAVAVYRLRRRLN